MKLVNVVATGDIDREIDLSTLADDIEVQYVKYEPEVYNGLQLRVSEDGPTFLIFRSGKYTVTGSKSIEELENNNQKFKKLLNRYEIIGERNVLNLIIVNKVCTHKFAFNIDLNSLQLLVGMENTEYEPEQSPFLVYRPENYSCVMTIAGTGNAVITGMTNLSLAENAVDQLQKKLDSI